MNPDFSKIFLIAFILICTTSCNAKKECNEKDLIPELRAYIAQEIEQEGEASQISDLNWSIYLRRFLNEDTQIISNQKMEGEGLEACNCNAVLRVNFKIKPQVLRFIRLQTESTRLEEDYDIMRERDLIINYQLSHEDRDTFCHTGELIKTFKEYVVMRNVLDQIDEIVNNMSQFHDLGN